MSRLGLNYIIEFQFDNLTDPPRYVCELCHCKCSLQSILAHIISIQHQQKFLVRFNEEKLIIILSCH